MANDTTTALGALYAAREVDGVNLMSAEAGVAMRSELEGMYQTEYILDRSEVCEIQALCGYPVRSLGKTPRPSCHWQLAVLRDMIRKTYERMVHPKTTRRKTLVVASAAREVAHYWSNPNVDFFIWGKEAKDGERVIMRLLDEIRESWAAKVSLPSGLADKDVPKQKRRGYAILKDLDEVVRLFEATKSHGEAVRRRIHLDFPSEKYDMLVVEDGHYNFSRNDWLKMFACTGASCAWVLGVMPVELLFDGVPMPAGLKIETRPGSEAGVDEAFRAMATVLRTVMTGWNGKGWLVTMAGEIVLRALRQSFADRERCRNDVLTGLLRLTAYAKACGVKRWADRCVEIVERCFDILDEVDHTQLVMTFSGHSNGYVHNYVKFMTLLRSPRIASREYNFSLSCEIVQRLGPMALVQVLPCDLGEPVVRTISLPERDRCVKVLDILASYDFVNDTLLEPKYRVMTHREFYDVIDFMAAQKPETLTVQMAMTMIRRGSAGLSLGKAVVAPPWRLSQDLLFRMALTTSLVAMDRRAMSEMVSDDAFKKMITGEEERWKHYVAVVLRVGLAVATAGLSIPLFGMYSWLTRKTIRHPLFVDMDHEVTQYSEGVVRTDTAAIGRNPEFRVETEELVEEKPPTIESTCDFIAMLGDVGKQDPICMHARGQGKVPTVVSYTASDVAALRADMVLARDASVNVGLTKVLDEFIDELEKDRNGFTLRTTFELVKGPPGVGKSYTMRRLMATMVANGKAVAVHSPMSKLAADYTVAENGIGPFPFYTTHKLYRVGKLNMMVVEEYTNMDERILCYMAYRTGAQIVILVGDEQQTGLQPDEGVRPFDTVGKLRLDALREHILPKNFRSDAYTVALLNVECGYCIYAENAEVVTPKLMETSAYDAEAHSAMVFSKQTGRMLQQADPNTVRRNQGQTHGEGSHVYVTDVDTRFIKTNPLFAVAVSRRKVGTDLVFYADTSEARSVLENRLRLSDTDFQQRVLEHARPDYRAYYEQQRRLRFGEDVVVQDVGVSQLLANLGALEVNPLISGEEIWWNNLVERLLQRKEEMPFEESIKDEVIVPSSRIRWCTLEVLEGQTEWMGTVYKARQKLRSKYIQYVHKHVKKGDVSISLFKGFLRDFNVRCMMFDTRDGTISGDWRPGAGVDWTDAMKGLPINAVLFNYNGSHVWSMPGSQLASLMREDTVVVNGKRLRYTLCDTIEAVEIRNNVTIKGKNKAQQFFPGHNIQFMPHPVNPALGYIDTVKKVDVAAGIIIVVSEKAGGIGLFGKDPVFVQSERVHFRNSLAQFMSAENDLTCGGASWIERTDRFPETIPLEKEMAHCADAYLHGEVVDPSVGTGSRTNDVGASRGPTKLLQKITIKKDPLFIRLDRRGRHLGDFEVARAFGGGYGYTQTTSVVEALGAAERYFVKPKGSRPSVQGRRHARDMAARVWYQGFDDVDLPWDAQDGIQHGFRRDALTRSYDQRALGLHQAGVQEREVTFSNKAQFKVCKTANVEDKIAKVGQGISATSSAINLRYGGIMRQADHAYAYKGKSWNIFDCYMSDAELMERVGEEFAKLPSVARPITSDADEFDSVQNWHSAHAEVILNTYLVGNAPIFQQYVAEVRTNYPVNSPGLFSGMVVQAKPSGAPDTLGGNTKVSDMYTEELVQGRGPLAMVKKGDDKSRMQYDQRISRDKARLLAIYSPLKLKIAHGDTQFCGKVVSQAGLHENLVGIVRKALAHWDKEYRTWAEYQISLRDRMLNVRSFGLEETVAATASAMGCSLAYAWHAYGVFQSLCHISKAQWEAAVVEVERNFPAPNTWAGVLRPWGC